MTTKALGAMALFAMIVGAASPPAQAISLDFVPAVQSVSLGAAAQVALRISGLGDLAAPALGTFDLDVSFDPSVLAFLDATYGDPALGDQLDLFGLGSFTVTTPGAGVVNLFELSLDPPADLDALQAGEFTLATLNFSTLAAGTSLLGLTVNALGDAEGIPLAASVGTGSITVEGVAAVPEPTSLGLLAAGLVGLVGLGWRRARRRPA